MSVQRKLLLVSLATLLLPVSGWLYLRQMDSVLRQSQEHALSASAHMLARTVNAWLRLPDEPAWHVQHSLLPLVVDGYDQDWARLMAWAEPVGDNARVLLGEHAGDLYMLLSVTDASADRLQPQMDSVHADHVNLWLGLFGERCHYRLAAAAPGMIEAKPLQGQPGRCYDPLRVQWQRDGSGYRVEMRLPATARLGYLGLQVVDASAGEPDPVALRPVMRFSADLSQHLAALLPQDQRVRLLDQSAWVVAEAGSLGNSDTANAPGWLATAAYGLLVGKDRDGSAVFNGNAPRLDALEVWQALSGVAATSWRGSVRRGRVTLATVVPLPGEGAPRGVLVLEQSKDAMPLLSHRGLLWLLLGSLALLLLAGVLLASFALRLGTRLRRLRDAVRAAAERPEQSAADVTLPDAEQADELGDLARDHQQLLDAVAGYTDYLRMLASRLSHELNTPLAIVHSSLDNLDQSRLPADQRAYLQRAREGSRRMTELVRAMSAAGRIEQAIAQAEMETFDLKMLVAGCGEGYRLLADTRHLQVELPSEPLPMRGAPDLIVQALDKLFDNARSFTPENGWVRLSLSVNGDDAVVEMANQGPLLPDGADSKLFDSLVSLRGSGPADGTPHLGLGLYIARMIARQHRGHISAANLEDGSGVVFGLHLARGEAGV